MKLWLRYLLLGIIAVFIVVFSVLPGLPAVVLIILFGALLFRRPIREVISEWILLPKKKKNLKNLYKILKKS